MTASRRVVLERYEGGSSTADIRPDGSVRVSSRLDGKTINSYHIEADEMAKLVPAWLANEADRKQRIADDLAAKAERQRIIDEAKAAGEI